MSQNRRLLAVAISAVLFPSLIATTAHAAVGQGKPVVADPQTDQLIIRFKDNTPFDKANAVLEKLSAEKGEKFKHVRRTVNQAMVFKFGSPKSRSEWGRLQRWLKSSDSVDYAEPDYILNSQAVAVTDDAYSHYQWSLSEAAGGINVLPAWGQSSGTNTVVAVIDTGYRPHADLVPNLIAGYDMISDAMVGNDGNGRDADASDTGDYMLSGECGSTSSSSSSWHGTHVAGTIAAAANNQNGIAGVAYNAKIQPVRTLGKCGGYTSDIADSVLWASGNAVLGVPLNPTPAHVLNLSLGGKNSCSRTMQSAIDLAVARNSVVVVAAGNSNADVIDYSPASCSNVITVAATGRQGAKAPYSNTGSAVDLAAPGGAMISSNEDGILSTLNTGSTTPGADTYSFYQGTSMAAPHVSGVAALMLSVNPALNPAQVETILKDTARPFGGSCLGCGSGIVDASAAVAKASEMIVSVPPEETTVDEVVVDETVVEEILPDVTIKPVRGGGKKDGSGGRKGRKK